MAQERKVFAGGKLRALRRTHDETQADMARRLGVSPSYVNLLERNQRNLSLPLLIKVCDVYGVPPERFSEAQEMSDLTELRRVFQDPLFDDSPVDLGELRAVAESGAHISAGVRRLYAAYRTAMDRLQSAPQDEGGLLAANPEETLNAFFRARDNHLPELEDAARGLNADPPLAAEPMRQRLVDVLAQDYGLEVSIRPVSEIGATFRHYDRHRRRIAISEALDAANRLFQLAHQVALLRHDSLLNGLLDDGGVALEAARSRGRLELANYFAAATLMPYGSFLKHARETRFDIDRLRHRFGVTFEMAALRLTTLQAPRNTGIPFFLVRIDQAGNVVKRTGGTPVQFARYGGACPLWRLHDAFLTPDSILTQTVELPDRSRYFTIMRTVRRPRLDYAHRPRRLAIALGCALEHADQTTYLWAPTAPMDDPTPIGINCGLCPRPHCDHRANPPLHVDLPLDEDRRGQTRFES